MTEELNGNGGALSPAGRFQRMEEALFRIESKLDLKADAADFIAFQSRLSDWSRAIELRLTDIEKGETPLAKILLAQFQRVQVDLENVKLKGSPEAQEGLTLAKQLEKRVEKLENSTATRVAVEDAESEHSKMLRTQRLLIGGLLINGVGLGLALVKIFLK